MYFEVKAFNKQVRRFENLDNVEELNIFVSAWFDKGFNKFVIKSFDSNGFRKRRFLIKNKDFSNKFLN